MRSFQKRAIETGAALADKPSLVLDNAKTGLQEFDGNHAITDKLKTTGDAIAALAQQADQRLGVSCKASTAMQAAIAATLQTKEATQHVAEESGLNRHQPPGSGPPFGHRLMHWMP